jgi:hypothetical protein
MPPVHTMTSQPHWVRTAAELWPTSASAYSALAYGSTRALAAFGVTSAVSSLIELPAAIRFAASVRCTL